MVYVETELKLRAAEGELLESIIIDPYLRERTVSGPSSEMMEAVYYDTPEKKLMQAGIAYRIRREGGQWTATVKSGGESGGGLHLRREWSSFAPGPEPRAELFIDTPIGSLLRDVLAGEDLMELFITRFQRKLLQLVLEDGSRVELAADKGEIIAGESRDAITEVELELKEGNPVELLRLGGKLAREYPLFLETRTKFYRGLVLAGLASPLERNEELKHRYGWNDNVKTALTEIILYNLHRAIKAQEDFLNHPYEPETAHQFWVKLRRLRSILSFAGPLIDSRAFVSHYESIGRLSKELDTLAKLDVLIEGWRKILAGGPVPLKSQSRLAWTLNIQRQEEINKVLKFYNEGRATPVFLEVWTWLLDLPWRDGSEGDISLGEFTGRRMLTWLKKMDKASRQIETAGFGVIHELWLRGEEMRDVLEELEPELKKDTCQIINSLRKLQSETRLIYDNCRNSRLLKELMANRNDLKLNYEAGVMTGWQACVAAAAHGKIKKRYRHFQRLLKERYNINFI